jgi:hypothetical protein
VETDNIADVTERNATSNFRVRCVKMCKYSIQFQKAMGTRKKGGDWLFLSEQKIIKPHTDRSNTYC